MSHEELIGRVLKDVYQIEAFLGEGGPSVVFRGMDLLLHVPVAIKYLKKRKKGVLIDPERFLREARTQSRLVHQNIVGIRTVLQEDGDYFIVMEYVPGRDLGSILRTISQRPCFSLAVLREIFSQILAGLGYAHREGVVHRDMKPANLLVRDDLLVKIADFGIAMARADSRLTDVGVVLGSPCYMAPEQIQGQEPNPQTDIYSVGISLYEAICGFTPFEPPGTRQGAYELLQKHIHLPPPPPSSLGLHLPPALEEIVLRSLSKSPTQRFADCLSFQRAIEQALSDEALAQFNHNNAATQASTKRQSYATLPRPPMIDPENTLSRPPSSNRGMPNPAGVSYPSTPIGTPTDGHQFTPVDGASESHHKQGRPIGDIALGQEEDLYSPTIQRPGLLGDLSMLASTSPSSPVNNTGVASPRASDAPPPRHTNASAKQRAQAEEDAALERAVDEALRAEQEDIPLSQEPTQIGGYPAAPSSLDAYRQAAAAISPSAHPTQTQLDVISFPVRKPPAKRLPWPALLMLFASLALIALAVALLYSSTQKKAATSTPKHPKALATSASPTPTPAPVAVSTPTPNAGSPVPSLPAHPSASSVEAPLSSAEPIAHQEPSAQNDDAGDLHEPDHPELSVEEAQSTDPVTRSPRKRRFGRRRRLVRVAHKAPDPPRPPALPVSPPRPPRYVLAIAPMAYIPEGPIQWGRTVRRVHGFWLDRFEVTVRQYRRCMQEKVCKEVYTGFFRNTPVSKSFPENHPMIHVSWADADLYCNWARKRLPSRIEWARAARGDGMQRFPWGEATPSCAYAHYRGCGSGAQPVGSSHRAQGRSPQGVYDLAGNVWEWLRDCAESASLTCATRYIAGGSWKNLSQEITTFSLRHASPDTQNDAIGFRCVWRRP
ncbi:SUMF1/EgtB/PvdO family nonheme iron enzyme [Myxococcota bacterium]|nr:SUMF1/EgtB/PvdO family nonheme iron enzyme [Myxococcota bacterium]